MSRQRGRAQRREDARRAVARARKVVRAQLGSDADVQEVEALARKLANNMAACSCPLCGNPRKWLGSHSVQELREALDRHDG